MPVPDRRSVLGPVLLALSWVGLLYAAIEAAAPRTQAPPEGDRLRADLVDGAFAALVANDVAGIRDPAAFEARRAEVAKALFGEAMGRLQQAEEIWLINSVRGWLRAELG